MDQEQLDKFGEFPKQIGTVVFWFSVMQGTVFKAIANLEGCKDTFEGPRIEALSKMRFTGGDSAVELLLKLIREKSSLGVITRYEEIHKAIKEVNKRRGFLLHRVWLSYIYNEEYWDTYYKGKRERMYLEFVRRETLEIAMQCSEINYFFIAELGT